MSALDDVRDQLAAIEPSGGFATRRISPAGDLHLHVKGIGRIPFPISRANARRLAAVGRPARYGQKDRTRFDRRVRDTGEIAKSLVTIDEARWARRLAPMLEQVRRDLGLPDGVRLRAVLHNLLVYEPGQFFAVHQDSEKTDDMLGTLVVILPAEFTGDAMVIEHHDARVTYRGARGQLTFVAFYADCHHEVRPITSGHRIVLTYNLIATRMRSAKATAVGDRRIQALARTIQAYFEAPRPPRWSSDTRRERPDRLVYLLDHQYTRRSLAWHGLKNTEGACAAALRAVADRLDCEIVLALTDVHESWSCEDTYETSSGYRRRGWRWHEDEDEEFDEADTEDEAREPFDLTDLLDSDVELRHWVGSPRQVEGMPGGVDSDEVCFTKASDELEPFASEHEGYMGNYGNTVDRRYHRAAVVLWPRERTFLIRARVAPRWAINEIRQAIHDQNLDHTRSLADRVTPFWNEVAPREEGRGFLERTLQVAADLDSPAVARALVQPFTIERLTPRAAAKLTACCRRYGFSWCETVLGVWTSDRRGESARRLAWAASLPNVCRSACSDGSAEGVELARWLVTNRWDAVVRHWSAIRDLPNPSSIVDGARDLSGPILGLLQGSVIAVEPERQAQMLRTLMTRETRYPTAGLVHLLRAASDGVPRNDLQTLGLASVRTYCVEALGALSRQPVRAAGDWAIAESLRCPCRLCDRLGEFLRDPARRQFEWPLAKDHRAHVHHVVDAHGLPVSHVTRRAGRPFTLVLTRTDAIFQREAAERTQSDRDLKWLTDMASAFEQSDGR